MSRTIKIGVIGAGHLGNFHLKHLAKIPEYSLVGFYDSNENRAKEMEKNHSVPNFESIEHLTQSVDAVSVVTPTPFHFNTADIALNAGCHVFIEKPITDNITHAWKLLQKAEEKNKIIQVGHIERFNPAFRAVSSTGMQPRFIESHRLAPFNPRGNDVPVILDLMIHDLDVILSMVNSDIRDIKANGVKVVSSSVDIANARLEFQNGCVANITASRISQKSMRKMRLFQEEDYITIDFQSGIVEEYKILREAPEPAEGDKVVELAGEHPKYVHYCKPEILQHDALREELLHFAQSIKESTTPETDGASATKALSLALEIQKIIDKT